MSDILSSVIMLAAAFLIGGAYKMHRKGEKLRALLMVVLAMIMIGNVLIWIMPTQNGDAPSQHAATPE